MHAIAVILFLLISLPGAASACTVALLLMKDVSQSVDAGEYRLQTEGLARALEDPEISESIIRGEIALAVMQWSGSAAQEFSIPWRQIRSAPELHTFVSDVRRMPRAYVMSNTAIGDAVKTATAYMAEAPSCARLVIDVSGDGPDNAGSNPLGARYAAERAGITINGLAIESLGLSITKYYENIVTTRGGFVITARGYRDYARAIREKIARETAQIMF